ncbi:MAG: hypothetical protein NC229_02360 [Bacteroides sp.]|nr:hypothetical protein [Bacteroides sp.]MCM1402938.1 hypothetical protein [Bacteroides sp.]MCM1442666.1 hypothetical protein [Muribaculum sp.]
MKHLYLLLYYGLAKALPKSNMPIFGKQALRFRYWCCRHLFAKCGIDVNVEQGAYFGYGHNIHAGNHVSLGKNFRCHNFVVYIDDYLLMGEDVLFQGGGMYSLIPTSRLARRVKMLSPNCTSVVMCG